MVQLSHPYITTGKTVTLTRRTFVGKVMSLLFKMLSRLVIAFLPRSKHLLISWLQSSSVVILEPRKICWIMETVADFIFLDFKINADSNCSHEIKRCSFLGRKGMANIENILKSKTIQRSIKSKVWFF